MSEKLNRLIRSTPCLWKGERHNGFASEMIPTGYDELDQTLPGGGWPRGVVVELMSRASGIGELRLMLPAIKSLIADQRFVVMVNPPYLPYAPGLSDAGLDLAFLYLLNAERLQEALWAAEKILLNPLCGMVLLWSGGVDGESQGSLRDATIRRLQVAAQTSRAILTLYRIGAGGTVERQNPWAAIRLVLSRQGQNLLIDIVKVRGSCRRRQIGINLERASE